MSILNVETVTLLIGFGILILIGRNRNQLSRLPGWRLLYAAYAGMLAGWIFTNLEEGYFHTQLNFLEHLAYAAAISILSLWTWKTLK